MIYGYSERGIFNSIIYWLDAYPQMIGGFLEVFGVKGLHVNDYEFTFLNEQSFSDFGDSDLIIIAKHRQSEEKTVLFIEGKVKTYQGKFDINREFKKCEDLKAKKIGSSSDIFTQLYYKYLLSQLSLNKKFRLNSPIGKTPKKLGYNKVVEKAFTNYISNAKQYFYIAILPDDKVDTKELQDKYTKLQLVPPMDINNVRCVCWKDIEKYFAGNDVSKNFIYNKGQIY